MKDKLKMPKSKKIMIAVGIALTIVVGILLSIYLIINSYIGKMNLVNPKSEESLAASTQQQEADLDPGLEVNSEDDQGLEAEPEDIPDAPDSPEVDITAVEDKIQKNMEENSTPIMDDVDVFNILFIGSDTRKSGENGRSDAMIVISINKKTKTITATSLMRDIYLQIPGKKNNRINTAYTYGADLLMDTIEQNFKLKINRYVSVDFYAFIDIVNAVGGVTLEVKEKDIPVINSYIGELNRLTGQADLKDDYLTEEGTLLLNGKQALGYSRNRYVGNNDFERTARQRRVLEQIFTKVKDLNLIDMNDLLNIILPQVTTNLTKGELFSLILSLPIYKGYELQQLRVPVNGSYTDLRIRGMEVLGIDFEENIGEIQSLIYGE